MARILIADDNTGQRDVLLEMFDALGHTTQGASDGLEARTLLENESFDLLITDLRMPNLDGIGLLEALKGSERAVATIVITAHGSVDTAVKAMHLGAVDYVEKPFPLSAMEVKVEKALEGCSMRRENQRLKAEIQQQFGRLIGGSPPMQQVFDLIGKVSKTNTPVLLLGESGTGKELAAREIHQRSARADGPFITVNCAALAEGVLESELFGHEKGAFTGAAQQKLGKFELAHNGSLFLDELGEIPLATQVKLLRFLQEKELERVGGNKVFKVDVRVIAATNRDLKVQIEKGAFREDLFYRINVISIRMPALRTRREDIPRLVESLMERHRQNTGLVGQITDEVLSLFQMYEWPGNVRELENELERALVLAEEQADGGRPIRPSELRPEIRGGEGDPTAHREYHESTGLMDQIERIEREIIRKALTEEGWNQTRAAKVLSLKRSSLQYKMKKYDLQKPEST